MPTMVLRFPGGRYHATPGGHHVNEGVVEWPPSPWRLVRALIGCGYSTQHWGAVPPAGRRLIEALSSVLPEYRLPPAALGHSRHYMPMAKLKDGREETTLVLDAFADVGGGELWVRWATTVDAEAQLLFDTLASRIGYLGRAESWVLGEAVPDDVPLPAVGSAVPHTAGVRFGRRHEQVSLTAPDLPSEYAKWREAETTNALQKLGLEAGNKATPAHRKKIDSIQGAYPLDLVDCIQRDTAWWRARRWSRPPGARSVLYWREGDALQVSPPRWAQVFDAPRVEMMLLALTTPSGSRSALPPLERTLPQADLLHRGLVSKLGFGNEVCPEIVGRDDAGEPMKGHRHAHLLPVDLDGDGRIDHVVVFATMGLGGRAQLALRSLRRSYMKGGVGELQVAVAGTGKLSDLLNLRGGLSRGIVGLLGPKGGTGEWTTATPFVPPRHLKKAGRSSLEGQVKAELEARGLPSAKVEVLDWSGDRLPLRHFIRRRQRGPQPPVDVGFALRLVFDRPVTGPICLGYGSHFGLGRFGTMQDAEEP